MKNIFYFVCFILLFGVGCGSTSATQLSSYASLTNDTSSTMSVITQTSETLKKARIITSKGTILVELFSDKSPQTVENFINLAKSNFYDGTRFHRVISNFMIQGGDPISRDVTQKLRWGTGGPGYTFKDEFNDIKLVRGSFAMANAGPNTNGSQFFIVTAKETPWLDGKHTNFGKIIDGMDVVDSIEKTPTDDSDHPIDDVIIKSIIIEE